jgi:L-threonylcarbamoyladenylate synthase
MSEIKHAELVNIDKDFDYAVEKAAQLFLDGNLFAYPTDTIYGIGANPFNSQAIKNLNIIKSRDEGKMYILLINNIKNLSNYIVIESEKHWDFLLSIWPNPVSVILKLNNRAAKHLGMETAAFRIPNHRFCQKLIDKTNIPLISTSVNRNNKPPLREFTEIRDEFSTELDAIFYTEKRSFFEASTIIDLSIDKPALLREGKIKFNDLVNIFEKS